MAGALHAAAPGMEDREPVCCRAMQSGCEFLKRIEWNGTAERAIGMHADTQNRIGLADGFFAPRRQRFVGDEHERRIVRFKLVQGFG